VLAVNYYGYTLGALALNPSGFCNVGDLFNKLSKVRSVGLHREAVSKIGAWIKIKAGLSFNPQAYWSRSRT
jgi:hypothetical protein